MKSLIHAAITVALAPALACAQPAGTPLEIGRTHRLQSRALNETRVIDVTLPRRYAESTERYPVLFVLDGEFEYELAAGIGRFYAGAGQIPQLIIVGVRNTNRMRDMTPRPMSGFQVPREATDAGGADAFVRFLADELVPWVDSSFRTAPMRVLVGHSLGGLTALYSLTQRPAAFTGYIVMEPSTWWNDERHLAEARATLAKPEARRARVMMVNARSIGVDTTHWGGAHPMVRDIDVSNESHQSMAAAGMIDGLRRLFEDFRPPEWKPGTRPILMLERYDSLAARVGYAVPIPANAYDRVARMSAHGRYFDDAERVIARMEQSLGASGSSRSLRQLLEEERTTPIDPAFVPLVIPARRPSPREAARFLGRWISDDKGHELEVRAADDTIVVHGRIRLGGGDWDNANRDVIQVTPDGKLEWGLRWFRGIPALVVLTATVQPDGTLRVTRQPRGWVPRGPGSPDMTGVMTLRRVVAND